MPTPEEQRKIYEHFTTTKKEDSMTNLQTAQYNRKPFTVDAIQVTAENMAQVSEWCNGDIREAKEGQPYIKVRVARPLNERQTRAFSGDWVLYAGTGYKVYTNDAFKKCFDARVTVDA